MLARRAIDPDGKIPWKALRKNHRALAARISVARGNVTTALRSALNDSSYNPEFTKNYKYNYRPGTVASPWKGAVGPPGTENFGGAASTEAVIGLNHVTGQAIGVGLSDPLVEGENADGGISGGVLSGALFLGAFSDANPGLGGYLKGVGQMLKHTKELGISDAELVEIKKRILVTLRQLTNERTKRRAIRALEKAWRLKK